MFSRIGTWREKRRERALILAITMLTTACASQTKSVRPSLVETKIDYEKQIYAKRKTKYETILRLQLRGVNSRSEIERIIGEFTQDRQKRKKLAKLLLELYTIKEKFSLARSDDSSIILAMRARRNASYDYFYGEFEKGKHLFDSTRRELLILENQFAVLDRIEALINGKFNWAIGLREQQTDNDKGIKIQLKRAFQKYERILVAKYRLSNDKKFIQSLKDLRMLIRRLHKLYSKTKIAFPKTQEYLQNTSIRLGGVIESLESRD